MKVQAVRQSQEDIDIKEKVVLAYSGGLGATAIIPWLKECFGYEIVRCRIDCSQGSESDGLGERTKLSGVSKLYIEDLVNDFYDDYITPCVRTNVVYENEYLLGTSVAHPTITEGLVEVARKEDTSTICHGAIGKGNDRIRFKPDIKTLASGVKIIAPWHMTDVWTMQSREDEIEYCKQHGISLPFSADSSYNRDRDLWHISHGKLELEGPSQEPNYEHLLILGVIPEKASGKGEYVTMTFERGVPTNVNGEGMEVSDITRKLNELGGKHSVGIVDIVENCVIGMRLRSVCEAPGGIILIKAHQQLEKLVLDHATMETEETTAGELAQIVHESKWLALLREAIRAFVESAQEYMTDEVKFRPYKGNIIKAGTTSPYSLYNGSLASFITGNLYDHYDADGFITLFGSSLRVRATRMAEAESAGKGQ